VEKRRDFKASESLEDSGSKKRGADFLAFGKRRRMRKVIPDDKRRRPHFEAVGFAPRNVVGRRDESGFFVYPVPVAQYSQMVAEKYEVRGFGIFLKFAHEPSEFGIGIVNALDVVFERKKVVLRKRRRRNGDVVVLKFIALVRKMVFHRNGEYESRTVGVPANDRFKNVVDKGLVGDEFPFDPSVGHVLESDETLESEKRIGPVAAEKVLMVGMDGGRRISGVPEFPRDGRNVGTEILLVRNASFRNPRHRISRKDFEFDQSGLASKRRGDDFPSAEFLAKGPKIRNRIAVERHSGQRCRIPKGFAQNKNDAWTLRSGWRGRTVFLRQTRYGFDGITLRFPDVEISEIREEPSEKSVTLIILKLSPRIFFRREPYGLLNGGERPENVSENGGVKREKNGRPEKSLASFEGKSDQRKVREGTPSEKRPDGRENHGGETRLGNRGFRKSRYGSKRRSMGENVGCVQRFGKGLEFFGMSED
jgi:hypothetical protein